MSYCNEVTNKRTQLKKMMDDFTTFSWGPSLFDDNKDAFDTFGVFIVGGKDALKFSNGPSFSNKYASMQFNQAHSILTGVEFKTQTISFTMGVYWFTIQEYRKLLMWLHPYEVKDLSFSFAKNWRYIAKLSSIKDSTRYILGRDSNGEYRYYTEIQLSFEVQGDSCLNAISSYNFIANEQNSAFNFNITSDFIASDLNTPLEFSCSLTPLSLSNMTRSTTTGEEQFYIKLTVSVPLEFESETVTKWDSLTLFEGEFSNLSLNWLNNYCLNLRYLSDSGLLLIKTGNGEDQLLTLQTTTASGKHLVETFTINKFKIPGLLEEGISEKKFKNIVFHLDVSPNWVLDDYSFVSYARTNVI